MAEGDGENVLLIVDADGEEEMHARLAGDPWGEDMLTTVRVEPWSVWLRAGGYGSNA